MKTTSELTEGLRSAFEHPDGGVVGTLNELLALCPEDGLQFDWQSGRCDIRSPAGDPNVLLDVPLSKSVFRALLARVAALCNERKAGSVSPYGGEGELASEADPSGIFQATFANTGDEQTLEIVPKHQCD